MLSIKYGFLQFGDYIVNDETFLLDRLPTSQTWENFKIAWLSNNFLSQLEKWS